MDTTETYVKMCEKAVEIQVLAKLFEKDQYSFWVCSKWHLPVHSGRFFSDDIWLPRQDQLWEIFDNTKGLLSGEVQLIYEYMRSFLGHNNWPETWEQLLLRFVMKELWGKIWSIEKEEWVKE